MRKTTPLLNATILAISLSIFSFEVDAGSASATVQVQLNAISSGTCATAIQAQSFALPNPTSYSSSTEYVNATLPTPAVNSAHPGRTSSSLNQTFNLVCGSAVTVLSMSIAPSTPLNGYPSIAPLIDSGATPKTAFGSTNLSSGMGIYADLVSINGAPTPFSFMTNNSSGTAVPLYNMAFSVGTTPVPIVWRPVLLPIGFAGGPGATNLNPPSSSAGYSASFTITVNH